MSALRANRRGIIALLCGTAAFTVNDTLTKIAALTVPIGEIMFIRALITIVFMFAALVLLGELSRVRPAIRPAVIARSLADVSGSACFIAALVHMGIAELSALVMAAPLILTVLAVIVLKEPVGWRRWTAIVIGLAGTMLVAKPSPTAFNAWALLGFGAALGAATRDLFTLRIDRDVSTLAISFFSVIALTIGGLLIGFGETWHTLDAREFALLAASAIFYSAATYLVVLAFRSVEVSVVSPFRYVLLIWAGIAGYVAFGDIPDRWSMAGAVLIVGSGLYTLHREAVRHRPLATKVEAGR